MGRNFYFLLFLICCGSVRAQKFNYPVPDGWATGIIPFPLEFAPEITHSGEEYVRTSPQWREPGNQNLWTYCYLWWIDNNVKIAEQVLEKDLTAYYGGLVARNIISRKIPSEKVVPTVVTVTKIKHETGFGKSFMGTVRMLDYLSLEPITLHVRIHVKECKSHLKLAVLFEVSPQPLTDVVWNKFAEVRNGFQCAD